MAKKIMKEEDYFSILNQNDIDLMRKFLLSNGKKQKPISPIYYIQIQKEACENEEP